MKISHLCQTLSISLLAVALSAPAFAMAKRSNQETAKTHERNTMTGATEPNQNAGEYAGSTPDRADTRSGERAADRTLSQQMASPTDAEIAHIVVTANSLDVDGGKLAKSRSQSPEVKQFADQMINDHKSANDQASRLTQRIGLKPQESELSRTLRRDGESNLARLKGLKGRDFDREYIRQEIAFHQTVLDTIDRTLAPNARNPELKSMISQQVRPAIEAHLNHAKALQAGLGSTTNR